MSTRRLLIVDDEPDFTKIVANVGTGLGYAVEVTNTAAEFQAAFLRAQPDLICLDLVMPDMDGVQLIQWLVKQDYRQKVIIISGFNPEYMRMAKLLAEVRGHFETVTLRKPALIAELRQALT